MSDNGRVFAISQAVAMSRILYELRFSVRRLRKDWRISLPVIAIFALAIGATTSVFTLVDAILYRDLPLADANRLVRVWSTNPARDISRFSSSNEDFLDWSDAIRTMELTAIGPSSVNLTGDGVAQRVVAAQMTANFGPLLGVETAYGRWFTEVEDSPGGPQVAVLPF
jgi:putative ABC transport system permease protein